MSGNDVVSTITIKGVPDGLDDTTASVNKLSDAMDNVSVVSNNVSKSTSSVQSALDRQQRSLDTTYRSQQQYNQSVSVISRALDEGLISQDRANQLTDLAAQKFDKAASSATPFSRALTGVQTQLVALAAGAGPVGVFLASFGPWGLAAAAGIGGIVSGFEALTNAADQLGQKAQGLQTFGQITGLTTDQIQKLEEEGSKFGIQTDTVGKFLDQFSVKLTTAREAAGPYYDMVRQINSGLAQQVLTTHGEADQLVILAAAYAKAGENGNALLQAAAGRGGVQIAPLLGAINTAGSVGNLTAAPQISADEIARMTAALNTNAIAWDHIKTNVGAIAFNAGFSDDTRKARDDIIAITAAVRDFSPSQAWNDFVAGFARIIGAGSVSAANFKPPAVPVIPVENGGNLAPATGNISTLQDQIQNSNVLKATNAALGSAATAQDQYNVKMGEAKIALDQHILSETQYGRVLASLGLDKAIQLEGQRISLLGQAASVDDLVKQKEDAISQARQKGVTITAQEASGILATVAAQKLASDTSILTTNNVVTAEQLRASKLAELNALLANEKLNQDQVTASMQSYQKTLEQTIQQQQINNSTLTNTATLAVQTTSLRNQLDLFSTDTSNNVGAAFVSIATGASTAKDAFANLEAQVIKSLANMLIQFTIVKGVAMGFESILGGGFNLLGPSAPLNLGTLGGTAGGIAALHHAGYGPGDPITAGRYVHPAYFDDAPRFHSGVGPGERAAVITNDESVLTPGQMRALSPASGGTSVEVNVTVQNQNGSNVQVQQQKNSSGGVDLNVMVLDAVNNNIASGKHDKVMRARFGATPQNQRR